MTDQPRFNRARNPKHATQDAAAIDAILDAGLVGHVGFVAEGRPMVMPMAYARGPGCIWLHGASKARIVKLADGAALSMTVTLLDGIVAARSGFHHSVNYRSAVVHGTGRLVTDAAEHDAALQAITEHLLPGRHAEIRAMTAQERKATGVIALTVEAASAKMRSGPPVDDPADHGLGLWAGVVPVVTALGRAIPDSHTPAGLAEPPSIARARARFAR
ncbi:pyridoxamine 5'-phosphate oxidase family protein [Roseicyclus persicicus]|uniref:Pyridoxamine 5'-phosphate oxidase family protein n=1 Tax=Roseicyclus persicicus TaxID=2650661 RepID=A0A7X6JWN9_9RHOB|nr:pyridoxamine 5'-phosphate oxidase family protein [Roseibacterium persicicum]NKX44652.1 pyridoxamine 5'-phosphate oxidase family protein [Roseibacterium persicicum]